MNFDTYASLRGYTIVASAMETLRPHWETDEVDGAFIWVVYNDDSPNSILSIGRLDVITGELRRHAFWQYTNNEEYVRYFAVAMTSLYEKTTGRDFASACPTR